MARRPPRRSPRLALQLPIRVFGIDFKGMDFVEDATTLVVSAHGAKIRLGHQLVPEQEIRILCRRTQEEAVFRVVCKSSETEPSRTFWGVECLNPAHNIWGMGSPPLGPKDQDSVRLLLQCPECRTRELLFVDEPLLESLMGYGGLVRGCQVCGKTSRWKQVPYYES
jgi:hypothetical protein